MSNEEKVLFHTSTVELVIHNEKLDEIQEDNYSGKEKYIMLYKIRWFRIEFGWVRS